MNEKEIINKLLTNKSVAAYIEHKFFVRKHTLQSFYNSSWFDGKY